MPDELWNEVRDIVQETGIKTIPRTGNSINTNVFSQGAEGDNVAGT